MITLKDLEDQRELIQDDLITVLHGGWDGMGNEFIDKVCQLVVDRFAILIEKLP